MSSTYVTKLDYLEETKDLIKQAIIDKGVSVSDSDTFRDYAEKIAEIETGGGGGEIPRGTPLTRDDFPLSNAVKERRMAAPFTFYDYDGTVLGQYTKAEIDAMTSEDDFPTPIGNNCGDGIDEYPLTFVGWNWTLDELKEQPYGINVGAIYAHILEDGTQSQFSMFLNITEDTTFSIGNSRTYGNQKSYFSIYDRSSNVYLYEDVVLNLATTVNLSVGRYILRAYRHNTNTSSFTLSIDHNIVRPYVEGICYGEDYYPSAEIDAIFANTNQGGFKPIEVKFVCKAYPLEAMTNSYYLSNFRCNHFNDAPLRAKGAACGCNTISFNSKSFKYSLSDAGYLDEVKLPINSNVMVGSYTTDINHTAQADKLTEIYIPTGSSCDVSSNTIENIYLEDSVPSIARISCPKVTELYIPDSTTAMSLIDTPSLEKLRLPETLTTLPAIPESLPSIYIPDGVTTINNSFNGCSQLSQVYLPDSVTLIKGTSFRDSGLAMENVRFPENVTIEVSSSSYGVFDNTPTVDARPFGKLNWTFGSSKFYQPFSHCAYLTKIPPIPPVQDISNAFIDCKRLKGPIEIPDTVESMDYTFQRCESLYGEIIVPPKVTKLNYTFNNCGSLKSIILPEGLTKIGGDCFSYCRSLTTITIPSTVTDMNASSIFYNCSSLREYHMKPTTPPTLSSYAFGYSSTLPNTSAKIYVPYSEDHSILAAYQSATNWSKYANYIVEEEI